MVISDQTAAVQRALNKHTGAWPNIPQLLVDIAKEIGNGAGLLSKPQGHRVYLDPDTPIASDIICFPDGHHFDVLIDGSGPRPTAAWQDKGYVNSNRYIAVDGKSVPTPGPGPSSPDPSDPGDPGTPSPGPTSGPAPYQPKYASSGKVGEIVKAELAKKLKRVDNGAGGEMSEEYIKSIHQVGANIAAIVTDFSLQKAAENPNDGSNATKQREVSEAERAALQATIENHAKRG